MKYLKELGLGPGFSSMSPLSLINLMWYNRYTTNILKYMKNNTSNYDKYIFKKNAFLKKRVNQKTKKHHFHNKFHYCLIETK